MRQKGTSDCVKRPLLEHTRAVPLCCTGACPEHENIRPRVFLELTEESILLDEPKIGRRVTEIGKGVIEHCCQAGD